MKRILIIVALLFSINLYADLVTEGYKEQQKGNYKKDIELYTKACDGGHMSGCYNLALLYKNGQGVRQDYKKANELWSKACDGGDMGGCYNLGFLYNYGQGVRQNKSKAKELFGKACDGGNQKGCDNYKILNEEGIR